MEYANYIRNLFGHPVVIIINTFFNVHVRIWPHNRLKNHLVLLLVWVRISPTSDPIFLLAPLFFNSFSKSRRKHTSSATQSSWWWWENPANSEVHFASNSSGLLLLHFFNIFSNFFFSLLFLGLQWLKNTLKKSHFTILLA